MSNKESLRIVFSHMPLACEAPTCPADKNFDSWAKYERKKEYVAMDSKGNVWSIQNPNSWDRRIGLNGETILTRRPPNLIMKASDFKAASGGSGERFKKKNFEEF